MRKMQNVGALAFAAAITAFVFVAGMIAYERGAPLPANAGAPTTTTHGDADCDGDVDPVDAYAVLVYAVGLAGPPACDGHPGADVDGDGELTVKDAAYMLQIAAGIWDGPGGG